MKYSDFLKYQEKKIHGSADFPFVTYKTFIPAALTVFPDHWHDEIEIVYCFTGECSYYINFEHYTIKEGDILIIPPTVIHSFEQKENKAYYGISILFNLSIINNALDSCSRKYFMPLLNNKIILNTHLKNGEKYHNGASGIIEKIIRCYYNKEEFYELELKMHLFELFSWYFKNGLYVKKKENYSLDKNMDKIKRILMYIEEHYSERIVLEDIAVITNQSVYNLSHSFKKCTGQSPLEFINGYRLNFAAKLLIETENPIINIAFETGFNNVSYFNRAFKKKFCMTPTEYRKKVVR